MAPAGGGGADGSPADTNAAAEMPSNAAPKTRTAAKLYGNGRAWSSRPAAPATASARRPPPKKRIASMRLRLADGIKRATMSLYGTATMPLTKA